MDIYADPAFAMASGTVPVDRGLSRDRLEYAGAIAAAQASIAVTLPIRRDDGRVEAFSAIAFSIIWRWDRRRAVCDFIRVSRSEKWLRSRSG
jgi:hypothetical protein